MRQGGGVLAGVNGSAVLWRWCRPAAWSVALAVVIVWMLTIDAGGAAAATPIVQIAPSATFTAPVPVAIADNGTVVGNDSDNGMTAARPFTWTATGGFVALQAQQSIPPFEVIYDSITGVSPTGEVVGTANLAPRRTTRRSRGPPGRRLARRQRPSPATSGPEAPLAAASTTTSVRARTRQGPSSAPDWIATSQRVRRAWIPMAATCRRSGLSAVRRPRSAASPGQGSGSTQQGLCCGRAPTASTSCPVRRTP